MVGWFGVDWLVGWLVVGWLVVCLFVCLFVGGVAEGWAGWLVSWLVVWLDRLMVGWLAGNGWRKSVSLSQHTTFVTKCNH